MMKRFLYALLALCLTATTALAQTGTAQTKTQLGTEQGTNFPDNSSGLITPAILRQTVVDFIASWQQAARVNAQTGTSYTVTVDDYGKLVTLNNGSPVAVTLPQATTTFAVFNAYFCNIGAGVVTITPTTSTINGIASLNLSLGQCIQVISDATNYQIFPGPPPAATTFNEPGFTNCSLTATVASNLLTVALKDAAGNDPTSNSKCLIAFRSTTSSTGTLTIDTVQAALSINTNATGATLGSVNATAFRFWVVAFDNGGTVVLSLYNASTATSCQAIDETVTQSSTAISGSATSAGVYYTPNGTTLSGKGIRILGFIEYSSAGLTTAGTYASAPGFVNVFGTGGKRPCDIIQRQYFENAQLKNATGSAFLDTNLTKSISPISAANLIYVTAGGSINAVVTTTDARATIARAGTAIGVRCDATSSGGNNLSMCTMIAFDKPNTTASTAYTVRIATTDNVSGNAQWNGNALTTSILIQEIMG
jgi:hypothetical protein